MFANHDEPRSTPAEPADRNAGTTPEHEPLPATPAGTVPGKRSPKRSTAKRPALTLAAQVSGDFAIPAPSGTVPPSSDDTQEPARQQEAPVSAPAPDAALPPLPALSAEDAALKFETMPEAPEQRSPLDGQEPMRFVWARRWPFLTLASVAHEQVPTSAAQPDTDPVESDDLPPAPRASSSPGEPAGNTEPTGSASADGVPDAATVPVTTEQDEQQQEAPEPAGAVSARELPVADPSPVVLPVADPSPVELPVAEPSPAVPSVAEPSVVEPSVLEPSVVEPSVVEPSVVEPPVVEPSGIPDPGNDAEPSADAASIVRPTVDTSTSPVVLRIENLSRRFGDTVAVAGIDLDVHEGSFYGIVGPNGAGKTTTLSMVTGLLRPDTGSITVHGVDVWKDPEVAKRSIGVLPDRLRLFDRLTGAQLLYYSGVLRGLDGATVRARTKDLARAFGLEDALNRLVTDYSAGMTKKVALAAAMIHSPRLLVLDEPFESVDPVSAANVIEILQRYVAHGGTVVLSSHGMDLIQRVCDHVAIIVHGKVLAAGAVDDVRGNGTLEERFVELAGGRKAAEGMEWLHSFSD